MPTKGPTVSEHPQARDLLGPFVMGDLEPGERRAVERHLEECPACREEAESLRLSHERMLDLAAASEAPPPLEERIAVETPHPGLRSGVGPSGRRRRLLPRLAVAAAVALAVIGAAYVPSLIGEREVMAATLEPTGRVPGAGGEVEVRGSGHNMEIRLEAWGLPACERKEYYELWFVENGERVSAGGFSVGRSGNADVSLNAPRFADSYPRVGITAERNGDPRPSGAKMLGGELRDF